jgi:hypothetical protein
LMLRSGSERSFILRIRIKMHMRKGVDMEGYIRPLDRGSPTSAAITAAARRSFA